MKDDDKIRHLAVSAVLLKTKQAVGMQRVHVGEPELLQGAVTPAALADAVLPLLDPDSEAARRQREGLGLVRQRLGPPGAADRVAALALELAG